MTSSTFEPTVGSKPALRLSAHVVFCVLLISYTLLLSAFYVPAHPGVDQNGYMTTGRELVEHGRLYFRPHNPYQFIGAMMVQLPDGLVYAKYPPGVGVLAAMARLLGGSHAVYLVDPTLMIIGMVAAYVLFLQLVDEFLALIGVIFLMVNPVILQFADDANSHGAAFGFTTIGMCLLLIWLRRGGWRWGVAAGVMLGFCPWMRYTEALWCIPLLVALIIARTKDRRPWKDITAAVVAYAIPILVLMLINWASFGYPWRTGYWYCGEQGGFSWRYLVAGDRTSNYQGNWFTALGQFENLGMYLIFPLVLLGLGKMLVQNRRWGILLATWMIPSTGVYLLYYWAPSKINTVIYLRFFIDVMPAMILCALWAMQELFGRSMHTRGLTVGLLALMAGAYCLKMTIPTMERSRDMKINLTAAAKALHRFTGSRPVIFANSTVCNYLGSITNYRLYDVQMFSPLFFRRCFHMAAERGPHAFQYARLENYIKLFGRRSSSGRERPLSLAGYHQLELTIIHRAWAKGQPVFYIAPANRTWPSIPRVPHMRIVKRTDWPDLFIRPVFRRRRHPHRAKNPNLRSDRVVMMGLFQVVPGKVTSTAVRDRQSAH